MSNQNVYACLICGKYFQGTPRSVASSFMTVHPALSIALHASLPLLPSGRGRNTHAYMHSLEESHHVFINLQTLKVHTLAGTMRVASAASPSSTGHPPPHVCTCPYLLVLAA
jgi:U4/U6.U5 tri-snRNP-associated protein 2